MMRNQPLRIVIVGGGAVGLSCAHRLVDEAIQLGFAAHLRITIIEQAAQVGPGLAYADDVHTNLLNTRACGISVVYGDKEHFYRWLLEHAEHWRPHFPSVRISPTAFLPRPLFGMYLQHVARETERRAAKVGIAFDVVRDEAIDATRHDGAVTVTTESGRRITADQLLLCCGNPQADPFPHLSETPGYFASPYPLRNVLSRVPLDEEVLVIGSRLSAIDCAVALRKAGHRAKIRLISRGGRLPGVRGVQEPHMPQYLSAEIIREHAAAKGGLTVVDLADLVALELGEPISPELLADVLRPGLDADAYLFREIFDALTGDRHWQAVLYALNEVADELWRALREDAKAWLLKGPRRSEYIAYRVSIPVENASIVASAVHRGTLTTHGGLRAISFDTEMKRYEAVVFGTQSEGRFFSAPWLINATGFSGPRAVHESRLLRSMLERGMLRLHRHGGIDVNFDTGYTIDAAGNTLPSIALVGSLTSGVHYFTTALDINVRHVARTVRAVLERHLTPSATAVSITTSRSELEPLEPAHTF